MSGCREFAGPTLGRNGLCGATSMQPASGSGSMPKSYLAGRIWCFQSTAWLYSYMAASGMAIGARGGGFLGRGCLLGAEVRSEQKAGREERQGITEGRLAGPDRLGVFDIQPD